MIKAQRTRLGVMFFDWYTRRQLRRYFESIVLRGHFTDQGLPVLVIANHFSWWDGFIQLHLNNTVLKRHFHVMMLEEQLQRFAILRKGGAFSIKKGTRDMVESIQYCRQLLSQPQNMVLIFPQGKIQSLYTHPLTFEPGIGHIVGPLQGKVQVVFNVNLVDYLANKKPTLHIYYTPYTPSDAWSMDTLAKDYNAYMQACLAEQIRLSQV